MRRANRLKSGGGQRRLGRVARGLVEESGRADGADAGAVAGGLDFGRERGAGGAVGVAHETELDEIVAAKGAAQLGDECRCEAVFADLEGGVEFLAEGAELGFLCAGERQGFHVGETHDRHGAGCKPMA